MGGRSSRILDRGGELKVEMLKKEDREGGGIVGVDKEGEELGGVAAAAGVHQSEETLALVLG